jgi:hypothetical protein
MLIVLAIATPILRAQSMRDCDDSLFPGMKTLEISGGDGQRRAIAPGEHSEVYFQPLMVRVLTFCKKPIAGIEVRFRCKATGDAQCDDVLGKVVTDAGGSAILEPVRATKGSGGLTITADLQTSDGKPTADFHLVIDRYPSLTIRPTFTAEIDISGVGACLADEWAHSVAGCSSAHVPGESVTVTLRLNGSKMVFGGWTGACAGQGNPCTLKLDADASVAANVYGLQQTYYGWCSHRCHHPNGGYTYADSEINSCAECRFEDMCSGDPGAQREGSTFSCKQGCWMWVTDYSNGNGQRFPDKLVACP